MIGRSHYASSGISLNSILSINLHFTKRWTWFLDAASPRLRRRNNIPLQRVGNIRLKIHNPLLMNPHKLQRRYLQLILTEVGGNRRRAASVLGLNRRTIQRLIARYDLFSLAEKDVAADGESEIGDETTDEDEPEV